jgi:hypothetical protein
MGRQAGRERADGRRKTRRALGSTPTHTHKNLIPTPRPHLGRDRRHGWSQCRARGRRCVRVFFLGFLRDAPRASIEASVKERGRTHTTRPSIFCFAFHERAAISKATGTLRCSPPRPTLCLCARCLRPAYVFGGKGREGGRGRGGVRVRGARARCPGTKEKKKKKNVLRAVRWCCSSDKCLVVSLVAAKVCARHTAQTAKKNPRQRKRRAAWRAAREGRRQWRAHLHPSQKREEGRRPTTETPGLAAFRLVI